MKELVANIKLTGITLIKEKEKQIIYVDYLLNNVRHRISKVINNAKENV